MDEHLPNGGLNLPYSRRGDHLRLSVRLTPAGGRNSIDGAETADDGTVFLKARVSAVAEGGKANRALVELLAKSLRLPKSSFSILSGETARKKILRIDGDPEDLASRLKTLIGS
ncbi:hypothetical protein RHAB21_00141 [Pseudorhizobium halotolerans]|uniref:UPF0235 protein RHAB21_00141 n=1 Tax=Pseudorhizobium halotolerans TaxID=1233081 RepID=A0ABM8PCM1_9HYPH|nr:hypothetical protein RHAB21_00141 [Pseudorhizobium halotolerans]